MLTRILLIVTGMRDNACRERVAEVLSLQRGVTEVEVSLVRGMASVTRDESCSAARLIELLGAAGYPAWTAPGGAHGAGGQGGAP